MELSAVTWSLRSFRPAPHCVGRAFCFCAILFLDSKRNSPRSRLWAVELWIFRPARISALTGSGSVPSVYPKNDDTRYRIVGRSRLQIRFNPERIQRVVLQKLFCIFVGGSVQHGNVLYLNGNSDWRNLNRNTIKSNWNRNCLFGFLSKSLVLPRQLSGEFLFLALSANHRPFSQSPLAAVILSYIFYFPMPLFPRVLLKRI